MLLWQNKNAHPEECAFYVTRTGRIVCEWVFWAAMALARIADEVLIKNMVGWFITAQIATDAVFAVAKAKAAYRHAAL